MKLVHALMFSLAMAGCSSKPDRQASDQPTPRVTQTVTVSPTPTETPTPDVTHYRLMTVMAGHPDLTFVVALNGNTVGTLNGDTNGDLTPSVLPGDNAVTLSWSSSRPLKDAEKARLTIERQIPGQDDWTTVYSREVDSKTKVKQAKGSFTNEAIGDNSASQPGGGYTGGGTDTNTEVGGGTTPALNGNSGGTNSSGNSTTPMNGSTTNTSSTNTSTNTSLNPTMKTNPAIGNSTNLNPAAGRPVPGNTTLNSGLSPNPGGNRPGPGGTAPITP